MPSSPSILTDDSTTFAGYPELATKVDESAVADADLDEYAGAAYPNFVDVCLKDLNKAAAGEVPFTASGIAARFAGAPETGWFGNTDDIVAGDGTLSRGMTFLVPEVGSCNFTARTPTRQVAGQMSYSTGNHLFAFTVDENLEFIMDKTSIRPAGPAANALGTVDFPWRRLELRGNIVIDAEPATTQGIMWRDTGVNAFALMKVNTGELRLFNSANLEILLEAFPGGGMTVGHSSGELGFYGTTPQSKPTVTGSKGGNAALASLLTALQDLGLIVDSTT